MRRTYALDRTTGTPGDHGPHEGCRAVVASLARRRAVAYAAAVQSARHLVLACLALTLIGCAPKIGDKCHTSGDCSLGGQRICDTAQPGGYCTVQGCDPDSCPSGAVCVEWRYDPPRTAETWCMRACKSDSGCRSGYRCVATTDPALRSLIDCAPLARIIDLNEKLRNAKFCAATGSENIPDGGPMCALSMDAGAADAGAADAGVTDAGATDAGP